MAFHGYSYTDQGHNRDEVVPDESHIHRRHICLVADHSHPLEDRDRVAETDRIDPYRSNLEQVVSADDSRHGEGYSCEVLGDRCNSSHRDLEDIRDVEVEETEICTGREDVPPTSKQKALR